jgi:anti-sigma B factor antagonist
MPNAFTVTSDHHDRELTLHIVGELDLDSAPLVEQAAGLLVRHGTVRLDLSGVSFMDVCGLNALLRLRLRLRHLSTAMVIEGLGGQPHTLFDVAGTHGVFGTGDASGGPRLPEQAIA